MKTTSMHHVRVAKESTQGLRHAARAGAARNQFEGIIAILVAAVSILTPFTGVTGDNIPKVTYEPAYYADSTVIINVIELAQKAPLQAQADIYIVVYPIGWESLGLAAPQCSPCDHDNDGVQFYDFHDHVLDSIPSSPGHGEFRTLWHGFAVMPAYTGDAAHDALVNAAYAAHLPAKSEEAVEELADATLPDGSPVAILFDGESYFLCAVVNPHAAR
jgi:hypothetical protein